MTSPTHVNKLIHETSPYLLQHAHNPVNWYPWGKEALNLAKKEDKPIIVSIGYSACHWCHVMEHESFENDAIADLMNRHFVSIKIDREERPDVDQIYMEALQNMGVPGGWPLNVFLTPQQKPFYGGTYFPPQGWSQLLQQISQAFKDRRQELEDSGEKFKQMLSIGEDEKYVLKPSGKTSFELQTADAIYAKFFHHFDLANGGSRGAPKFPMPANWLFLLNYYWLTQSESALKQLKLTLDHMARGGIYDQIGGGFARYSVDDHWLVPHFEKMLYDNAQLIQLYSQAYSVTRSSLYKDIVLGTIKFLVNETSNKKGGYYAALDADSEGKEGKYYVWSEDEINTILGDRAGLIKKYFNTGKNGNWEGQNILHRIISDEDFSHLHGLELNQLYEIKKAAIKKLHKVRAQRVRPGLDNKILAGWNGLILSGFCDAYAAFGKDKFLELANQSGNFLVKHLMIKGKLYRLRKNKKQLVEGVLEDFAFVIEGFIKLYQVSFEENWLIRAENLMRYALDNFYDKQNDYFYYTDKTATPLIVRKKELFDNVIPSSNSAMAKNLHFLGLILDRQDFKELSTKMLLKTYDLIAKEPQHLSNWAQLLLHQIKPAAEIAIIGPEAHELKRELLKKYTPNSILMGTISSSKFPLLRDKIMVDNKTTIYVCFNKTCKLPVHTVDEALKQLM